MLASIIQPNRQLKSLPIRKQALISTQTKLYALEKKTPQISKNFHGYRNLRGLIATNQIYAIRSLFRRVYVCSF